MRKQMWNCFAGVMAMWSTAALAADIGTAFTYQGNLEDESGPVNDDCAFQFTLWDEAGTGSPPTGGNQIGPTLTFDGAGGNPDAVAVTNGLFSATLDFGAGAIDGTARWLAIEVCCPSSCTLEPLSPRVELTPVPHALALRNFRVEAAGPNTLNRISPNVIGGSYLNSVTPGVIAATIGGGGADDLDNEVDDRINRVTDDYGTVCGGINNRAGDDTGTTDGATGSTVCGGFNNVASHINCFIGGGASNSATGATSTIGGGLNNDAAGDFSTVAGGDLNRAIGDHSTVGGGTSNTTSGAFSTVPGGRGNSAGGDYSLAAGRRGTVRSPTGVGGGDLDGDEGTFVWADSTDAPFISTGPNQFRIRASAGLLLATGSGATPYIQGIEPLNGQPPDVAVALLLNPFAGNLGIGTTSPTAKLHVGGTPGVDGIRFPDGTFQTTAAATGVDTTPDSIADDGVISDAEASNVLSIDNGLLYAPISGNVGIGTSVPTNPLHVNASGTSTGGGALNEVVARFRNTLGATHTAVSVDAPANLDAILFLAEGGAANWDVRSDAGDNTFDIRYQVGGANDTRLTINTSGFVGIGTTAPANKLDVEGGAAIGATYSGSSAAPANGLIVQGHVGLGTDAPNARLEVTEFNGTAAVFNRSLSDGTIVSLRKNSSEEGTISISGSTVSYNAFTGSHYAWTNERIERGTLVTLTGVNRSSHDNPNSERIYGIAPSAAANDSKCLGAYLGLLEPAKPQTPENPHQVMAVGNGDMWVVDTGRNIEPGQYLISSDLKGHAMLDDAERFAVGYVVARAGEGVDWSRVSDEIDGRKHKRISVFFESFERGSAVGLGKIVEQQQLRIEALERAGSRGVVRAGMPLALLGLFALVAFCRRSTKGGAQ